MGGGWSGRWMAGGWESGSSIQKISSLSLDPRNSGSLRGGQAHVGWLLNWSGAPTPVNTTTAPAAEPKLPHACPPGTASAQPDLSTWLTLTSRGFQATGKSAPRIFFSHRITSKQCIPLPNSKLWANSDHIFCMTVCLLYIHVTWHIWHVTDKKACITVTWPFYNDGRV